MDATDLEEPMEKGRTRTVAPTAKLLGLGVLLGIILTLVLVLVGNKLMSKSSLETDKDILQVTKIDTEGKKSAEQEVTIEFISKRLQNIGELSTAEMIYTGLYSVTEGKIPFITKKGFSMVYTATVRAGIDVSAMDIDITNSAVTVTIPRAKVQLSKVDPDSIRFYDEKSALFNKDEKTDVTEAISIAEKDMEEKADTDGLLERADEQAQYIVLGLLEDVVGERKVIVKTK